MSKTYDFIIVGAGSAGCVIATTLIEKTNVSVLLLEAGPTDKTIHAKMPASMPYMMANHVWPYQTEPEPHLNNRKMEVPQGKILGGSSTVNGMAYVRGIPEDYDDWAFKYGCEGWDYKSVLADFIASENNESLSNQYHGNIGNQYVSENRYRHPLTHTFIRAGQELGFDYTNDFNGKNDNNTVGFFQTTTHQGYRASTAYAWLKRVKDNDRLTILTDCLIEKVLIQDQVATGVQYQHKGQTHTALAHEEVIISSGALGSPKILMLSGIGNEADLKALNIPVTLHSPQVGKNLQDHLHINLRGLLKEPISIITENMGLKKLKNGIQWLLFKNGIASSNILEGCGFFDIDKDGRRDTQIHSFPLIENFGRTDRANEVIEGFTLKLGQLYPESRGEVKLKSNNPVDLPKIYANYLADPNDLKAMVDAVKFGLTFFSAPSMKRVISEVIVPEPAIHQDDAKLAEFVRNESLTVFHPVGTCAMGSKETDVLDTRLNVRGIAKLRVIDSSSFPHIVSGNTNAPVIMLAYRGTRFIIEDYEARRAH
ncbi:GMC family oxidoreductase [Wohlfahrtiimonas chitiniclastica]|uniref:GMC family oxidoreductase n=1 Tax=Wohlfahrtiimonas chitiniclastica TaxID=400946 RepID=UPI001BCFE349|nr:GMC family oxidoreductase N-terminal domain-containing protein [Wohlfahrtiimonas chitiniclastica]MBS7838418.1 GMC family oxidoreductase N-terminal domain-containing protein [Wohlfahrtiimonas chitiniclastica]